MKPPKGKKPLSAPQKELLKLMAREAARQYLEEEEAAKQPQAAAGHA